jgi:hypothetical protein
MIPALSDSKWRALITGQIKHNFKCVPAGLMFSRLNREAQRDNSLANLEKLVNEAHSFFNKYERILTDDIKAIFG